MNQSNADSVKEGPEGFLAHLPQRSEGLGRGYEVEEIHSLTWVTKVTVLMVTVPRTNKGLRASACLINNHIKVYMRRKSPQP
jgi:hypothetical protein